MKWLCSVLISTICNNILINLFVYLSGKWETGALFYLKLLNEEKIFESLKIYFWWLFSDINSPKANKEKTFVCIWDRKLLITACQVNELWWEQTSAICAKKQCLRFRGLVVSSFG